jgi:hypothetical protein
MMLQSDQFNELAGALAKAQGEMGNAVMNRVNPHFKSRYADMGSVLDAIRPPLSANGLAVVQQIQMIGEALVLRTILMHASGQFIASEYPLPSTENPQGMGSALTYARRYSIATLVCNASDEDDDANEAKEDVKQLTKQKSVVDPASKQKFIEECKASIARIGASPFPKDLQNWWTSEVEKKKRRDFELSQDEVDELKDLVTEQLKRR